MSRLKKDDLVEVTDVGVIAGEEVKFFAKYVTAHKDDQVVVERDGHFTAYHRDNVVKVMPKTFGVRWNNGGTVYHFLAGKTDLAVGDWLLRTDHGDYSICEVVEVDSKAESATKHFTGRRLVTEEL